MKLIEITTMAGDMGRLLAKSTVKSILKKKGNTKVSFFKTPKNTSFVAAKKKVT